MKDKSKTAWQTRLSMSLFIVGLLASIIFRFIIGPGLLPFFIAAASIAIAFVFFARQFLKQIPNVDAMDRFATAMALVSLIISLYCLLAVDNYRLSYLFLTLNVAIVSALIANRARFASGPIRHFYMSGSIILAGMGISFLSLALAQDSIFGFVGMMVAVGVLLLGVASISSYQKEVLAQRQQQRREQLLDTTKADPFYAEQTKVDKVKEQR